MRAALALRLIPYPPSQSFKRRVVLGADENGGSEGVSAGRQRMHVVQVQIVGTLRS
jgi:hypothetical protein